MQRLKLSISNNVTNTWLRLSRPALWSLLKNSGLDGRGLSVYWNPDCLCYRLFPKSRRLPFSGFLPLNVSSPAVGDILRSGHCRCVPENGRRQDFRRRCHLARNCSIKIIMPAVKASVIYSWGCLPQPGMKHRGEGILRMEDAGTSEEDDDIDSQDSNIPIDHGHLARNCSIMNVKISWCNIIRKTCKGVWW